MKSISQILNEITGGVEPMCTVKEIAGACKVHEQTVYSWTNPDGTEPRYSQLVNLSHYLIQEYNYHNLAMQMMLPCSGRANGRVLDDLMKLYEFGTDLSRAFADGNKNKCEVALGRMDAEMEDLKKEVGDL
ncbi:hypothetical protein [Fodinibius sp.]|uniref:hypothetical protein n=1 Tax=Fodinibius sp. TaxID=1872440 RepID=UPI002ACE4E56|nr:hypothetical protein [Fodinibius sp.]MDZ7658028.1 hypothetical protein [Fodinibius sp.]